MKLCKNITSSERTSLISEQYLSDISYLFYPSLLDYCL